MTLSNNYSKFKNNCSDSRVHSVVMLLPVSVLCEGHTQNLNVVLTKPQVFHSKPPFIIIIYSQYISVLQNPVHN